jgi:rhomboid protease GluP
VLVGINSLVFVAMVLWHVPPLQPTSQQLLPWGANYGPLTLDHQWWRLLTATFVHIGIVHLALNMWCLWNLGVLAEHLYGWRVFLPLYLLTGIAASIASVVGNPLVVSAGASGAIFGLAGALIATLWLGKLPAPRSTLRTGLASLIVFAAYTVTYGFVKPGIDNRAHLGGLASGLLLGAVLSRDFRATTSPSSRLRPWLFPTFAVVLLAATLVARGVHRPVVWLAQAERQFNDGQTNAAVDTLSHVLGARPDLAPAWSLLGAAYIRLHREPQAEAALLRAEQLKPSDPAAREQLGLLYLRARRYEQARSAFEKVIKINPNDTDSLVNLGLTLNQLGRSEEAVASLRKAVTLAPELPSAWFNLGLTAMNLKRYDEAVKAFAQTTRITPADPESWVWLANAYQASGMTREADAAFLKAYQLRTRTRQPARR